LEKMVRRRKSWGTIRSGRNNICGMKDHQGLGWCILGIGTMNGYEGLEEY
jgi:hypothetical protein